MLFRSGTVQTETKDRREDEATNLNEDESTNTSEDEKTHKKGIEGITNQELIETQRRVVVFNIINWIIDRVARELIVGLW